MVDVCTCEERIVRDATKDELGPAYEAYKDGKSFDQKYREDKQLKSPWYGKCCQPEDGDLTWEEDSDAHYVLLAIFVVLCLLTLALWRAQRDHQALKARKWGITASHAGTLMLLHLVTTLNHCMGPSASCGLQLIEWFLLQPLVLFHYTNAAGRLLFVHQWSQSKLKQDGNTTQLWYYRHQYVLKTYVYLIMKLGMALVGVVLILALYFSEKDFFGGTDEMWAVTRCSWWQIPEEYQQPTLSNGFCNCADYGFYDESTCIASIQDMCVGGGNATTIDVCSQCGNDGSLYDTSDCQEAIYDLLVGPYLGQCGWYRETPDFTTCRACVSANTTTMTAAFVYVLVLAGLGLFALYNVMKMRDRLGILQELTSAFALLVLCYTILLTQMFSEDARVVFVDGWQPNVSLSTVINLVIVWMCYLFSLLIPFIRAFFGREPPGRFDEVTTRASIERFVSLQMRSAFSIGRRGRDTDLEGATADHVHFQRMLQFCFDNEEARDLYQQFAAQEFTVENLQFLAAINDIVKNADKLSVTEMGVKALEVFDTYVCKGARLQVNIAHTVMDQVTLDIMGKTGVTAANRHSGMYLMPIPNSIEDVLKWFKPAIEEVQTLIQRDSWPRFMKTKSYKRLLVLYESHKSLHDRLRKVGGVVDNRGQSPRRNTPRRGSLDMTGDDDDDERLQNDQDVIRRDNWLL